MTFFFRNGQEWWKLRSEFQKNLSQPRNVRNLLPSTDQMTREFIAMLPSQFDGDHTIRDMVLELERLSLELTCLITFDERMHSFSDAERHPDSRSSRLIAAGDATNSSILPTDQGMQLWRLFETKPYKQLREAQEYMQQVAVEFVHKRANQKSDDNSLLDQYLKNPKLSVKDLIGMSSDMLLAGVHTTSFTSAFALYRISKDQTVQDLMHQEALRVLPSDESRVTTAIMNSEIPYTRAVLKETFRLNPISIGVGRILNQDTVLGGYLVPKNVSVVY
jgi:ecdysteroid 25-hydroxylase CYP302A1